MVEGFILRGILGRVILAWFRRNRRPQVYGQIGGSGSEIGGSDARQDSWLSHFQFPKSTGKAEGTKPEAHLRFGMGLTFFFLIFERLGRQGVSTAGVRRSGRWRYLAGLWRQCAGSLPLSSCINLDKLIRGQARILFSPAFIYSVNEQWT